MRISASTGFVSFESGCGRGMAQVAEDTGRSKQALKVSCWLEVSPKPLAPPRWRSGAVHKDLERCVRWRPVRRRGSRRGYLRNASWDDVSTNDFGLTGADPSRGVLGAKRPSWLPAYGEAMK